MSPVPLHKLISHGARRRELDAIESLPLEQQREKMTRLEAVRQANKLELRSAPYAVLIVFVVVLPYLAIRLSDVILSFSSDALRDSVWFPLLIVVATVMLVAFCVSSILVPYGNALRELDYRRNVWMETARHHASMLLYPQHTGRWFRTRNRTHRSIPDFQRSPL